jgi:hypothetical protein
MADEKPKFDRKAHMAKMTAIRQAKRAEKKAKENPEPQPEEVEDVVEIPLLSKAFKNRDKQMEEEARAIHEDGRAMGASEGYDDAVEDSGMFVRDRPTPRDDANTQFWAGNVMRTSDVNNSPLQKLLLSSVSMSNYPSKPGIHEWFYVINRIKYTANLPRLLVWHGRYERDKAKYMDLGENNPEEQINPFFKLIEVEVSSLDADSKSRLSGDMIGLKEYSTERRQIKKEAMGTGAEKIKDAVRRD